MPRQQGTIYGHFDEAIEYTSRCCAVDNRRTIFGPAKEFPQEGGNPFGSRLLDLLEFPPCGKDACKGGQVQLPGLAGPGS